MSITHKKESFFQEKEMHELAFVLTRISIRAESGKDKTITAFFLLYLSSLFSLLSYSFKKEYERKVYIKGKSFRPFPH